jgi:octaprenyl-diphosphate synthase
VGGDLREGKATLPVLELLDGPHGDEVRGVLERRATGPGDVGRVRDLVLAQGTDERTREEIRRRARLAVDALDALPASQARTALADLARHETRRAH